EVQIVVVHVPAHDVDLAHQTGPDLPPIPLEILPDVVVVALPRLGDRAVDRAGRVVPDGCRVAVLVGRAVGRLPDREILPAPPPAPAGIVELVFLPDGHDRLSIRLPLRGSFGADPRIPLYQERIGVGVEVDQLVPA